MSIEKGCLEDWQAIAILVSDRRAMLDFVS